jgi:hypothetical protein
MKKPRQSYLSRLCVLIHVAPVRELSNLFYYDLQKLFEFKPDIELMANSLNK